jgi:hypothetical protein
MFRFLKKFFRANSKSNNPVINDKTSLEEYKNVLEETDNYKHDSPVLITNQDKEEILFAEVNKLKEDAVTKVNQQIGRLNIDLLEKKCWDKILALKIKDDRINEIRNKFVGITPLLESGELYFSLLYNMTKENDIPSANLQTFSNANEIMLYVCFVLSANEDLLRNFINTEIYKSKQRMSLHQIIESLNKYSLIPVLNEYRYNRNIIAHTYQLISKEAAKSYIQRTYESIQRMELILNPL